MPKASRCITSCFTPIPRYNLPMSRTAAEILEEARQLPPSEFDWLIGELLQEGDGSSEGKIEAFWRAENDGIRPSHHACN